MPISIPSSTLDKFTNFGDLLRFLRRRVSLTQMELANAVGYSHMQISRLEQNLRLPDIPIIESSFVYALGLEEGPKVIARLLELAANVRREDAPTPGLCPYKGLNFYDESDADLFVGREVITTQLVERVLSMTLRPGSGQHSQAVTSSLRATTAIAWLGRRIRCIKGDREEKALLCDFHTGEVFLIVACKQIAKIGSLEPIYQFSLHSAPYWSNRTVLIECTSSIAANTCIQLDWPIYGFDHFK